MIPTKLPETMGESSFRSLRIKGIPYIIVINYFFHYIEILVLTTTTSSNIIVAINNIFSRHSIPYVVVSDNGPQYASKEFT